MDKFSLPKKYSDTLRSLEQQLTNLADCLESPCQNLDQALSAEQSSVTPLQLEPASSQIEAAAQAITELQQYFTTTVQPLDEHGLAAAGLSGEVRSRFRSIKTEMHRQLRLLSTDVMFLRSARQLQTQQQRQQQLQLRLQSLQGYCAGLLDQPAASHSKDSDSADQLRKFS